MWDLIVSVPDHCLSFYFDKFYSFFLSRVPYFEHKVGIQSPNQNGSSILGQSKFSIKKLFSFLKKKK